MFWSVTFVLLAVGARGDNESFCGYQDDIGEIKSEWFNKTNMTWYFYGHPQYNSLIQNAFDLWTAHIPVTITRNKTKPNFAISLGDVNHFRMSTGTACEQDFDGRGHTLAHAYQPNIDTEQTDIHIDSSENWYYGLDDAPDDKISFHTVLVHEIGHALGLEHSLQYGSIMFPFLHHSYISRIPSMDVISIQTLYGQRTTTPATTTTSSSTTTTASPTSTTTTTASPTTSTTAATQVHLPELCKLRNEIDTILVANKHIYLFYEKYVWKIPLDEAKRTPSRVPELITDWLTFLPNTFKRLTGVYQATNNDIVLLCEDRVYVLSYPGLSRKYAGSLESYIGVRMRNRINTVFNTNRGKVFIVYNDSRVLEYNECDRRGMNAGIITDLYNGLPSYIKGSFRYTDGNIYFIGENNVFVYNEFSDRIVKVENNIFDILNISCVKEDRIKDLYAILKDIFYLK